MTDRMKQIKENWFPKHVAKLSQQGQLKILDWHQPGTGNYYCRYIFDGKQMYISGDIGEAVFNLTSNADVHSFNDIHLGYFMEKLTAYHSKRYNYNGKQAAQRLEEWKIELLEDGFEFDYEEFTDMVIAAQNCNSEEEWAYTCVNDTFQSLIDTLDSDAWEWIYNIGNTIPDRIVGYLVGLQTASEQIKKRLKTPFEERIKQWAKFKNYIFIAIDTSSGYVMFKEKEDGEPFPWAEDRLHTRMMADGY